MKDIVYVNGDSFAEGSDTASHLYPFFKKYHSLHDIITEDADSRLARQLSTLDEKYNFISDKITNKLLIEEISQFEINNRWPSTLAKELGVPVYNLSSQGGSSMYAILHRTMSDLYRLQKQGYTITDVIIQLTSANRYSFFNETQDYEEPQYKRNHYHYHIKTINAVANTEIFNVINSQEPIDMAEYRWLHDVYLFRHAMASVTDARLILVDSAFYRKSILGHKTFQFDESHWLNKNQDDYLLNFKKQLDDEVELSMLDCIDLNEPETVTDGMHFTAKVHELFAKKIAERYFQ